MSLTLVPSEVTASEVTVGSWVKVRAFSDWEQPLVVGANVDEVDNGMSATVQHKPAYQWLKGLENRMCCQEICFLKYD